MWCRTFAQLTALATLALLLLSPVALGRDNPALCELSPKSILSRSSSGLAQVSNLGEISITCRVPTRSFPTEPGTHRNLLKVVTTAYEVSPEFGKRVFPSEVHQSGGGYDPEAEWVSFDVHIPLDFAERDAEARRYLARLEKSMAPRKLTKQERQRALGRLREFVYQDRMGHFQIECRVTDGDRPMGVGVVELEVLFKGRFSDVGLPAAPPV